MQVYQSVVAYVQVLLREHRMRVFACEDRSRKNNTLFFDFILHFFFQPIEFRALQK